MNNSAKSLRRVIALLLLVATALTMVSCDSLQSIIGGGHTHNFVGGECVCGETDPNYVHEHYFANGVCVECGAKKEETKQEEE